jgi:hypothetical protein
MTKLALLESHQKIAEAMPVINAIDTTRRRMAFGPEAVPGAADGDTQPAATERSKQMTNLAPIGATCRGPPAEAGGPFLQWLRYGVV